jgi:hypothetical protein
MKDKLPDQFQHFVRPVEPTMLLREDDYRKWARKPYWSGEECVALSLSIGPHPVSWTSPFSRSYGDTLEQIRQAQRNGQLSERIRPVEFLAWARQHKIDFSNELEKAVSANEVDIEQLQGRYEQLRSENRRLRYELDQLRTSSPPQPKELSTKERGSLHKLVIGMAVAGYRWDPKAARSPVPKEIAEDLKKTRIGPGSRHCPEIFA